MRKNFSYPSKQAVVDEGYTFDDVLIRPAASAMEPSEASLKTTVAGIPLALPFLSAAMDRVTEARMAITLGKLGGLGVIHRNCSIEEQARMVREARDAGVAVAAACGPFAAERAQALDEAGASAIVIDCAHGHNLNVVASAKKIKKSLKKAKMIYGNIATGEAAKAVIGFVDAVKVGVGRLSERRALLRVSGCRSSRRFSMSRPFVPKRKYPSSPTAASAIRVISPKRSPLALRP